MRDAEATCRAIYVEARQQYADVESQLGSSALGFRVLYGPPTIGAPYLFMGYQPGGREIENIRHHESWPEQCDYATEKWLLAKKVRFVWGDDIVARCTGLNAIFFRAPSIKAWLRIPKQLRGKLEEFSLLRARTIVNALQPKQLVLIGLGTFDRLLVGEARLVRDRGRVLAKEGNLWGHPAIGLAHLSGSRISAADLERLRTLFSSGDSNRDTTRAH
jgi:hypothetical protein